MQSNERSENVRNKIPNERTLEYHAMVMTRKKQSGSNEKIIEGYFAVFDTETELWPGAYESIARGAFDGTLKNDIRALTNHEAQFVLGRTSAGTLTLRTDSHGLWGSITLNEKDLDAMNLYERVKRGDVDQCSFGFQINSEDVDFRNDGSIKWTIKEIELFEVSVVTFPAYEETEIQAK
jgi:uncharacterized protein